MAGRFITWAGLAALATGAVWAAEINAPAGALFQPTELSGWSTGVRYESGRRKLSVDDAATTFDMDRLAVRVGYSVRSFLHLSGEVGTARLEQFGSLGDWGASFRADALLQLVELDAPERWDLDSRWQVTLGLDTSATYYDSTIESRSLTFVDLRAVPTVTFTVRWRESGIWLPFDPKAVALQAGVIGALIEGEHGDADVKQAQEVGFNLEGRALFDSGWVAEVGVNSFGSSDTVLTLGLAYNF